MDAIEKATQVAYASMNERLTVMNEFRASMSDMSARSVTRIEFDQMRERLGGFATCGEIEAVEQRVEQMRQIREAQIKALGEEIQGLSEFRAELRGKASTTSVTVSYVIAGIGILFSIISLIEKLSP